MPLERRTTYDMCSSSLDEAKLKATGLFGFPSLRRHVTIGMLDDFMHSCISMM